MSSEQLLELYEELLAEEADPSKFDELGPTITNLDPTEEQSRNIVRTLQGLIDVHAEKEGYSIEKPPYNGRIKGKTIGYKNNFPDTLKAIIVAYFSGK